MDIRPRPYWKQPSFPTEGEIPLEDPPQKVRQKREQQQHEYSADPDEEVQGHLWIIDPFLIQWPNATTLSRLNIGF